MPVKVLMTWDISPEHEREYFEFVIGEFIPGVQRLGFQTSEAWVTIYGSYPQIQVGMLAPGLKGALIVIDLDPPHLTPRYDPDSHLVYAAGGNDVSTSIINGRVVMKDRRLLTLDVEKIMADVNQIADEIRMGGPRRA